MYWYRSDSERLEMDLTNILNGVDTNEGRSIRKFIRDLSTREALGSSTGATPLNPVTELANTRVFIEQVVNSVMENYSEKLNKATVKPLPRDKLKDIVNIASERAVIMPLQAQLMCFAMTGVSYVSSLYM